MYEECVERVLSAVKLGLVSPGDRLPAERDLVVRLGVSRVTLRGALRSLTEIGWVEVRRGHPLHTAHVEFAATTGTRAEADRALTAALADCTAAGPRRYRTADSRLHPAISNRTGSTSLAAAAADIRMKVSTLLDAIPLLAGVPQLVGTFGLDRLHRRRSKASWGLRNAFSCRHTAWGLSLDRAGLARFSGGHVTAGDAPNQPGRIGGVLPAAGPQRAQRRDREPGREGDLTTSAGPSTSTAAHGSEVEILDSHPLGGSWTLDQLWERLGIGAAIRRVATSRRLDGTQVERVVFALVAQRIRSMDRRSSPTTRRIGRWTSCSRRSRTSPQQLTAEPTLKLAVSHGDQPTERGLLCDEDCLHAPAGASWPGRM